MNKIIILVCCLFIISVDLQSQTWPGPVGIGTNQPRDLLHVRDGSMRLEGSNQFINFMTKTPHETGLRFLNGDGKMIGTWLYRSQDETMNLTSDGAVTGLIYNFKNNFALLGRNDQIGENEKFGLRINTPKLDFGGMNIETSGHRGSKPYYGYAINGKQEAIHYYDGVNKSWKLKVGKDIMAVTSDGKVGIGTNSPISRLHVHGSNSNLATSPGLLTIGGTSNHIAFGISTTGLGQIYSKSNAGKLVLGGAGNEVLTIDGFNKRVGIGTNSPGTTLAVNSTEYIGFNVKNSYSGISNKYAVKILASSEGTGEKYGIWVSAVGNELQTYPVYGGRFYGSANESNSNVYGISTSVYSHEGTGNHYGIHTTAPIEDPAPGKKSWALYSYGNSYFSNEVMIGNKDGATGYKLAVDGKIICEDLKMEPTVSWPDYVFEKDYKLKSLEEVEAFVKENNHLPGVPSAQEIKDQGGYEQGEMNRILLEKVEELTLYLIDQKKVLDTQNKKIATLEAAVKKQTKQ